MRSTRGVFHNFHPRCVRWVSRCISANRVLVMCSCNACPCTPPPPPWEFSVRFLIKKNFHSSGYRGITCTLAGANLLAEWSVSEEIRRFILGEKRDISNLFIQGRWQQTENKIDARWPGPVRFRVLDVENMFSFCHCSNSHPREKVVTNNLAGDLGASQPTERNTTVNSLCIYRLWYSFLPR